MPPGRTQFSRAVEASGGGGAKGNQAALLAPMRLEETNAAAANGNAANNGNREGATAESRAKVQPHPQIALTNGQQAPGQDASNEANVVNGTETTDPKKGGETGQKKNDVKIMDEDENKTAASPAPAAATAAANDDKNNDGGEEGEGQGEDNTAMDVRKQGAASRPSLTLSPPPPPPPPPLEVHVSEEDDHLIYGPRPGYVSDSLDVANKFEVVMKVKNFRDVLDKARVQIEEEDGAVKPMKSDAVETPDGYHFGLILFPYGTAALPKRLALFLEWRDPPEELQRKLGPAYSRRIEYRLEVVRHPTPAPGFKRKRPDTGGAPSDGTKDSVVEAEQGATKVLPAKRQLTQHGARLANGGGGWVTEQVATDDEEGEDEDDDDVYGDGPAKKRVDNKENVAMTHEENRPRLTRPGTPGPGFHTMDVDEDGDTDPNGEKIDIASLARTIGTQEVSQSEDNNEEEDDEDEENRPCEGAPKVVGPAPKPSMTPTTTSSSSSSSSFKTKANIEFSHTDDWKAENTDWGSNTMVHVDELTEENGLLDKDGTLVLRAVATPHFERYAFDTKMQTGKVGLENDGATCYLNSLLQTIYMTKKLRLKVYDLDTTHEKANNGIALELQRLFWQLQTSDQSVSTRRLTTAFGWKATFLFRQHDVQEMNRELVDKLEERMKGTSSENLIKELYTGKMRSYIKCINVDFESARDEEFYDIQLDVKNMRNVYEAFAKYIEVERLDGDNQYEAEGHGKQDAHKGVGFLSFPPVLNLHLKRFEFEFTTEMTVKINDEFRFPVNLRLDRFLHESVRRSEAEIEADPEYEYVLHSVLVHWGDVNSGHYYAFINDMTRNKDGTFKSRWLKFDDEKVYPASMEMAVSNNFGGRTDDATRFITPGNAYMLVYIRKDSLSDVLVEVPDERVPRALLDRFSKDEEEERLEEERRERERSTLVVRFISHQSLRRFYGYERGQRVKDLVDFYRERDAERLEIKKDSYVQDLLEALASRTGAADWRHLRVWNLIHRENNTQRVDSPPFGEANGHLRLRDVLTFNSNEPMPEVQVFVESWNVSAPLNSLKDQVEWPLTKTHSLLFFRRWRPEEVGIPKKLEHVGHALVSNSASYADVVQMVARQILPRAGYRKVPTEESRYNLKELCTTKNVKEIVKTVEFTKDNGLQHGDIILVEILPATTPNGTTAEAEKDSGSAAVSGSDGAGAMEIEEKGVEENGVDAARENDASRAARVAGDETLTVFFDTMASVAEEEDMKLEPRKSRASSRLEVLDDEARVEAFGPVRVRQDFTKLKVLAHYVRALDQRFVFSVLNRADPDMSKAIRMELPYVMKIEMARLPIAHALFLLGEISEANRDCLRLCTFNIQSSARVFTNCVTSPVTPGDTLFRTARNAACVLPKTSQENIIMYEVMPCRHDLVSRVVEVHYINGTYPRVEKVTLFLDSSDESTQRGFKMLGDVLCEKLGVRADAVSVRWIVEDMEEVRGVFGPHDVGDPLIPLPNVDHTRASTNSRVVADIVKESESAGEFKPGMPLRLNALKRSAQITSAALSRKQSSPSLTGASAHPIASDPDVDMAAKEEDKEPQGEGAAGGGGSGGGEFEKSEGENDAVKAPSTPPPPPPMSTAASIEPGEADKSAMDGEDDNGEEEEDDDEAMEDCDLAPRVVVVRHFYSPTPSKLKRAKIFGLPLTLIIRKGDTAKQVLERSAARLGLSSQDVASWRVAVMSPLDMTSWDWLSMEKDADALLGDDSSIFDDTTSNPVFGLFHPNPQRETAKPNGGLLSKVAKVDSRSPVINSSTK
ncbi:Ubiquitin carboxyl-terminal hydrolase 7 [Hondaea fermentalgiana]|uniref:Ubiquitin carboxyl-terminal hydrolase 7 n=1 Tax=Hondaea fermentalgiana TaxID=2315210 RepID=A0A2R5GTK4_9STRA|nr:Ubiquitin carboxyl-terminal hydrolase 7 [Hondaea fermentalgiana]|eukprot:GBG34170.1 Ubiquitin carboxyl-terminal hydrolase 7 [Hondaea fermentalgiana]